MLAYHAAKADSTSAVNDEVASCLPAAGVNCSIMRRTERGVSWITDVQLRTQDQKFGKTDYGRYLARLLD